MILQTQQIVQHDWGSLGIALAVIATSFYAEVRRRADTTRNVAATNQVATTLAATARDSTAATTKVAETLASTATETSKTLGEIHSKVNSQFDAQKQEILDLKEEIRKFTADAADRQTRDMSAKIDGLKSEITSLKANLKQNGSTK
jgi:DNA anti-recombination protein RmuC